MCFGPSFPGCGVYPLVVDNFCVLGPGLGWLRCVTAIMSRGRELSGSWLPGTHQPVKVSQPLSSQLILGATGDWGWLWADIWPLSPLHVMCHVTSSAALLTLQVSATVSCFFLAPGLVTLAWCQICPPPGELLELLTVSRLTRLATKVRSASGLGLSGNDRREWGREQWSQETMDHIRGWAGAMMAWLHSQCWLTVDKGFSFKTITSTVHSRCPDRNPLVDRSSLGMMRGCPPSWWWPGAGPGQPCVPAAPCLGPGPCLLSVSVPLPASCSHHPRCFCWRYTTHILM